MAKAAPASSDMWHRSLEDLLKAIESADAKSASGSFAINLQTSAAPIAMPVRTFPQFEKLRVYLLTHRSEQSTRFQLRLGIIESELEADAILATVRAHYPSATKEVIDETDRAAIAQAARSAQAERSAGVVPEVAAKADLPSKDRAVTLAADIDAFLEDPRWNIDELLPDLAGPSTSSRKSPRNGVTTLPQQSHSGATPLRVAKVPMTRVTAPPKPVTAKVQPGSAQQTPEKLAAPQGQTPPGRIARASKATAASSTVDTGTLQSLVDKIGTLVDAVETHAEAAAVARRVSRPAISAPAATAAAVASAPAPAARPAVRPVPKLASSQNSSAAIDSTQTIRALTSVELEDAEVPRWFVIQLMQSQAQIEPEQVPNLNIFSEYRLYAVCETDQERSSHALRLGFFSSEIAAQAVAGYLSSHFPTTNIKRVSSAERNRFAEKVVEAKKDVGEAGGHTVIEVSTAPTPPAVPATTASGEAAADCSENATRPAAGSFWSRLTRLRG